MKTERMKTLAVKRLTLAERQSLRRFVADHGKLMGAAYLIGTHISNLSRLLNGRSSPYHKTRERLDELGALTYKRAAKKA